MPTYDYECQSCGHRFEAFQQMTEGALRKCPRCGKLKLRRQIGAGAGLIFRGSGFYITDYKRNDGGSSDKGKGAEPSKGEGGSSAQKKDTKDTGGNKSD